MYSLLVPKETPFFTCSAIAFPLDSAVLRVSAFLLPLAGYPSFYIQFPSPGFQTVLLLIPAAYIGGMFPAAGTIIFLVSKHIFAYLSLLGDYVIFLTEESSFRWTLYNSMTVYLHNKTSQLIA